MLAGVPGQGPMVLKQQTQASVAPELSRGAAATEGKVVQECCICGRFQAQQNPRPWRNCLACHQKLLLAAEATVQCARTCRGNGNC